jgi:uncharacterized protein (TIGR02246 family)
MMARTQCVVRTTRWSGLGIIGAICLLLTAPVDGADSRPAVGRQQVEASQCGPSTITQEVEVMHARYLAAFNRRDAAAVAALFATDGAFVDSAGTTTSGRAAIEAMFEQGFKGADIILEAKADQIEALGGGAWDIGHGAQVVKGQGGAQTLRFHYTAVYTREDGLLKLRVVSVGTE